MIRFWLYLFAVSALGTAACGANAIEITDSAAQSASFALTSSSSSGKSSSSGGNSSANGGSFDFNRAVRILAKISAPPSLDEPEMLTTPQTNWAGDDYTVTARYRAAPEFNEVLALDPGSDVIWPGAIIQGESVRAGDYVPLSGKRAPLTLSISLENIQGKRFTVIDTPRLSSVRQEIGEILAQNLTGSTPARISFSIEDIHDSQQLALAVGASVGSGNNMIKAQFDFGNSNTRSRILVKFIQIYYTLDMDLPDNPGDLFARDANLNLIASDLGTISPLYVSSISYGRMAFFSFESGLDSESLKAAVTASCQALLGGVSGEISVGHSTILSNASISATIIGGNGATAVNAVRGFEGLKLHLLAGGNYDKNSPAAPISYKMRYLSDNTTARFVLSGEYEAKHTYRAYDWYAVRDLRLVCGDESGKGDSAKFYGSCHVRMQTNGINIPAYEGGSPADARVWYVLIGHAPNWKLDPGQWKAFGCERQFRVRRLDLDKAVLKVNGEVIKQGLILDSNLGKKERSVTLDTIPEGMIWLPDFSSGSTKARIGFSITRLPP
ncbi:MAG: thiol-activated cytolysin family protein [Spirochaetota bacterium]|jgi:thiol-activated cytolysin|nr:thiol-activated cytolysin family protein [Spirochaetota bacterium]